MENALNIARRRVVIERGDHGTWWIMFSNGEVQTVDSAVGALRAVKSWDRIEQKLRGLDAVISTIEWRNVPDGWTPPKR